MCIFNFKVKLWIRLLANEGSKEAVMSSFHNANRNWQTVIIYNACLCGAACAQWCLLCRLKTIDLRKGACRRLALIFRVYVIIFLFNCVVLQHLSGPVYHDGTIPGGTLTHLRKMGYHWAVNKHVPALLLAGSTFRHATNNGNDKKRQVGNGVVRALDSFCRRGHIKYNRWTLPFVFRRIPLQSPELLAV